MGNREGISLRVAQFGCNEVAKTNRLPSQVYTPAILDCISISGSFSSSSLGFHAHCFVGKLSLILHRFYCGQVVAKRWCKGQFQVP